jgi:hypothetical protein
MIFNDFAIYTREKNRIQERTNIKKIVKVTYYNRIYDNLVKLCPVVKVAGSFPPFELTAVYVTFFSVFELKILEENTQNI